MSPTASLGHTQLRLSPGHLSQQGEPGSPREEKESVVEKQETTPAGSDPQAYP